jgi:isoleucyl-tRNA synthetase
MDDTYRDRQDPALTVGFELDSGELLLAWTTTPWTLPSNLALAVGPDIAYAVVELDGRRLIIAEDRLGAYEAELGSATRVGTMQGAELVGRRYSPLFPFFAETEEAFQVLGADFVSVDDGTGIVHLAPGFGEDDQIACNAVGIPTICPMDEHGRYTAEVPTWAVRTSSTPTHWSFASSKRAASSCGTRPTTTPIRTVGGAHSHWSTGRSRPGSSRSRGSASAWSNSTSRSTGNPST